MQKLILLLISCFVQQTAAQSSLTATQWQDDLRFLQKTIHNDYSFLFKKTTKEAFDADVETLYSNIPNLEEHEIVIGLARLVSSFKYGHTVLGFRYQPHAFHQLPFNLYQFNDGVFIQGVHKDYQQALGAKVIAVAGVPIENALKAIYPVVPVENDQFFKAYAGMYLSCPEVLHAQGVIKELSTTVEFTLEKEGKTFKQTFNALPIGERVPTKYSLVQQEGDWLDARKITHLGILSSLIRSIIMNIYRNKKQFILDIVRYKTIPKRIFQPFTSVFSILSIIMMLNVWCWMYV